MTCSTFQTAVSETEYDKETSSASVEEMRQKNFLYNRRLFSAHSETESDEETSSASVDKMGQICSSSSALRGNLFAAHFYPTSPRLKIYSKANILGYIATLLHGTP